MKRTGTLQLGDTLRKPKRSNGKSFKRRPPKRGLTRKTIERALDRIGL